MTVRWDRADRPSGVRAGEELDVDALATWLGREPLGLAGKITVEQFPGGYSNLTYLVRIDGVASEWVLRRPPFGSEVPGAHDMEREYRVLSGLAGRFDKAPRPLALCADEAVLGAPFYLMERCRGLVLRGGGPDVVAPPPETVAAIARSLVETLAELHAVDVEAAGLAGLGRPQGYVARQVEGWSRRWRAVAAGELDVAAAATLDGVADWLATSRPASVGRGGEPAALVHNDFKHDNLVLDPEDPSRVVAVLDWEMATLGDPLLDLGTTLAYWTEPGDPPALRELGLGPTTWEGTPGRRRVAELYAEASGRDPGPLVFAYAFGLFKVAVILAQILGRYRRGLTGDARFAGLGAGVETLAEVAARAIERDRIDRLGAA